MTSAAVIATVLGYIAVLFAVAWVSGRRADNAGFFSGNRRTPWYMAAFAMIGISESLPITIPTFAIVNLLHIMKHFPLPSCGLVELLLVSFISYINNIASTYKLYYKDFL